MVSVITCTIRPEKMENVFKNYKRQRLKRKELIIVLNDENISMKEWKKEAKKYPNVRIYKKSSKVTLGECTKFAAKKARYKTIAKFDDDDYYAPYYLKEAVKTMKNKKADLVGKKRVFVYIERREKLYIRRAPNNGNVRDATLVFKKKLLKKVKLPHKNTKAFWIFQSKCRKRGYKIASSSRYNYTYMRRKEKDHTSKIKEKEILRSCRLVAKTKRFKKRVVRKV